MILGSFIQSIIDDSLWLAVPSQKIPQYVWTKFVPETMFWISSACMSIGELDRSIAINVAFAEFGGLRK